MSAPVRAPDPSVHVITLGCARNEVDSEELAARLTLGGFRLVAEPGEADAVVVNTCGFVEAAKKDSIDTLLAAANQKSGGRTRAVVATGCLAERYGAELAEAMPEADAVLGFDAYADIAEHLRRTLDGERPASHTPRDRRKLLPIAPIERQSALTAVAVPGVNGGPVSDVGHGPASGPRTYRRRLTGGPSAPLKIAAGCDRRCSFCAIPSFRGSYVSRPPTDITAEARWLIADGVREVFLVSENSSSYGKDLGNLRLLESLLGDLSHVDGLEWIRLSYLQPAEMRPSLIEVMTGTPAVLPYFDLSFQHASEPVLRRMRRFGNAEQFLALINSIRQAAPEAGIRTNVICGFPGETAADVDVLEQFLVAAELDAIGLFGYSDEDGTEAATLGGHLASGEIEARREHLSDVIDQLVAQRAESRIGQPVEVLVEETEHEVIGRATHQGPEIDGTVRLVNPEANSAGYPLLDRSGIDHLRPGDLVAARVVAAEGVDLVAQLLAGN
jgi:ribosomal protein S12 methylthiotransferase